MKKFFVAILSLLATAEVFQCNPVDNSPLIVGGFPADIADFPHSLALLDLVRGGPTGYICGASNIHRLWALSAAHCLQSNTPPESIQLYGGSTSRLTGGRKFFVTRYILHPNYSRFTLDNDVAVLQVLVSCFSSFKICNLLKLFSRQVTRLKVFLTLLRSLYLPFAIQNAVELVHKAITLVLQAGEELTMEPYPKRSSKCQKESWAKLHVRRSGGHFPHACSAQSLKTEETAAMETQDLL